MECPGPPGLCLGYINAKTIEKGEVTTVMYLPQPISTKLSFFRHPVEQTLKAGGWQDARGDTENTEPRGERGVPSGDTGPLNPDRGHRGDRAENFKQLKTDSQERHRRQGTQVTRRTHGS